MNLSLFPGFNIARYYLEYGIGVDIYATVDPFVNIWTPFFKLAQQMLPFICQLAASGLNTIFRSIVVDLAAIKPVSTTSRFFIYDDEEMRYRA